MPGVLAAIFLIFVPVIGVLVYIGTRSHDVAKMARAAEPPAADSAPTG